MDGLNRHVWRTSWTLFATLPTLVLGSGWLLSSLSRHSSLASPATRTELSIQSRLIQSRSCCWFQDAGLRRRIVASVALLGFPSSPLILSLDQTLPWSRVVNASLNSLTKEKEKELQRSSGFQHRGRKKTYFSSCLSCLDCLLNQETRQPTSLILLR